MTRTLRVGGRPDIHINETMLAALVEVERRIECRGDRASISIAEMAERVDSSPQTARISLKALVREGLVDSRPEFATDGGRLANSYGITRLGHDVLEGLRAQGLAPRPCYVNARSKAVRTGSGDGQATVAARMPRDEDRSIDAAAKSLGLTRSEFVRQACWHEVSLVLGHGVSADSPLTTDGGER